MKRNKQKGGIIRFLIIIIALIALASFFFHFSVQDVVENPQTQQNFNYIWTNVSHLYETYAASTVSYLWNDIFIALVWNNLRQDLSRMKKGEKTSFENLSPQVRVSS